MFSYVPMEFPVFHCVSIVSPTDNHCKESGSLLVTLSQQILPSLVLSQATLFQLPQPLLIQKMFQTFNATLKISQHLSEL